MCGCPPGVVHLRKLHLGLKAGFEPRPSADDVAPGLPLSYAGHGRAHRIGGCFASHGTSLGAGVEEPGGATGSTVEGRSGVGNGAGGGRGASVRVLGRIDGPYGTQALIRASGGDLSPAVRRDAVTALGRILAEWTGPGATGDI